MTVPVHAWFLVLLGEPLTMDGGLPTQGREFLEIERGSLGAGSVHSRLDPFPYSEPLTNLASYIGARGIRTSGVAKLCALEFYLVEARMRAPKQMRLESVHLPGDAQRMHVRRSRHLPFYDPKVEGRRVTRVRGMGKMETPKVDVMGRANETRTRTGCPFPSIDRGVYDSLVPTVSVNYGMTIMPLDDKIAMFVYKSEIAPHEGV
ncbi:hypothetical protein CRG98_027193 [Punica granatum]|uniref:Uncharacterized protein n=1 Tax=Punica granatum TaxID=22663 RepID=A0A2I0J832_PUNGR|nr:hypothetical protein CRG98_027193 [Punica granatum]